MNNGCRYVKQKMLLVDESPELTIDIENASALIPTRVWFGVGYLDLFNRTWRTKAKSNIRKLDMFSTRNGVLGLVYDNLYDAYSMHAYKLTEFGFVASPYILEEDRVTYLSKLQEVWAAEIRA